jgi:glycosyltransferase involved in cell wall biosynthesis
MDLLVITNNPDRPSFRQRIEIYLDVLRDNGIECRVVRFPTGSTARYKLLKQSANFDGVFLHKKRLNFLDAMWLRRFARKVIYDFDDAVMYDDMNPDRFSIKRQRDFRRTIKLATLVLPANKYLADHAAVYNVNVEVVPTGLNLQDYNCEGIDRPNDGKVRLVWIGSKSTLGYLAQIKPALEEFGSRFDNVLLRIIADDFFELQNMQVEKCRWSLETQVRDLATSDIGLCPLPIDNFTRGKSGGFKILQYAALGLPVIVSDDVNAEYICDGVNGFLAGDMDDWVEKIMRLVEDRRLRKQMGLACKKEAEKYDVSLISKKLCKLVAECLKGKTQDANS